MKRNISGFTLLEVIVVIAIIALLAGAIAPVVFPQISEQRLNTMNGDMEQIEQAVKRFYEDTGRVPPVLAALILNPVTLADTPFSTYVQDTCGNPVDASLYTHWKGPYLIIQTHDNNGLPLFQDPWGRDYIYYMDSDGDCTNIDELNFNPVQSGIQAFIYSKGVRGISLMSGNGGALPFAMNDDDGDGTQDEDPIGDPNDLDSDGNTTEAYDDDGDGTPDEDPPNTRESSNFYHLVSLIVTTNEKIAMTTRRLDTLEQAIKQFYRDTNKMPPTLTALVQHPGVGYDNWSGPYLNGGPDISTNPNLWDGWNNQFVYRSGSGNLDFNLTSRDNLYQAAVLSLGSNQQPDYAGDGLITPLIISDDDLDEILPGTGTREDEDPFDSLDNDGDGLIDEDPLNTDQNAPDPFRLISVLDVVSEKGARTREMLAIVNDAAERYNDFAGTDGIDNDSDTLIDAANGDPNEGHTFLGQIGVNGLDDDGDTEIDEDGEEVDFLRNVGYVGGSYRNDVWSIPSDFRPFRWDAANTWFYSTGVDGIPGNGDDVTIP